MRTTLFLVAFLLFSAFFSVDAQVPGADFTRLPSGTEYRLFRKDAAGRYQPRPATVPADAP